MNLERVRLGSGPTPVRELTELGHEAGVAPVWMKDDGAYCDIGGNKARSLSADDDGGFFKSRARAYYRHGALKLPR